MAHYAFLNGNRVTEVIVGVDENELINGQTPEEFYSTFRNQPCVRTSYNGNIRKQYAGIGFTYDEEADVFIAPQPYPSWSLDENHDWQAPSSRPAGDKFYTWDEDNLEWKEIEV